jgi:hypothetical protein
MSQSFAHMKLSYLSTISLIIVLTLGIIIINPFSSLGLGTNREYSFTIPTNDQIEDNYLDLIYNSKTKMLTWSGPISVGNPCFYIVSSLLKSKNSYIKTIQTTITAQKDTICTQQTVTIPITGQARIDLSKTDISKTKFQSKITIK